MVRFARGDHLIATVAGGMAAVTDDVGCLRFTLTIGAAVFAAGPCVTLTTRMSVLHGFIHCCPPRLDPRGPGQFQ